MYRSLDKSLTLGGNVVTVHFNFVGGDTYAGITVLVYGHLATLYGTLSLGSGGGTEKVANINARKR